MGRHRDRLRLAESSLYSVLCRIHGIQWSGDRPRQAERLAEALADVADCEAKILELGGDAATIELIKHWADNRRAEIEALGRGHPFSRLRGSRAVAGR